MNNEQPSSDILSKQAIEKINGYLEDKITSYLYFKDAKKMKLCQRFISAKPNKSYTNSLKILELIISYHDPKAQTLTFEVLYDILKYDNLSKPLLNDALKILKCHNLIDQPEKRSAYHSTKEKWTKNARYKLQERAILKTLAKLLLSFVKANIDNKPSNFFDTIDELIKFILKRSILHNTDHELELAIYTAIESKKKINVIFKTTGRTIEIEPKGVKIIFNQTIEKDSKKLIYFLPGDSLIKDISLSEIMLPPSSNTNSASTHPIKLNVSNYSTHEDKIQSKVVEKTKVILAVNSLLYEYFMNINIFEEMEIITDSTIIETIIREYSKENDAKWNKLILNHDSSTPSANFFILSIKDDKDFIAQEIQKNLQYVKIIHPLAMYETVKENMTIFLKNEII